MQQINDLFELSQDEIEYRISALTEDQLNILTLIAQGKTDKQIASILSISAANVRARLYNGCDRIGVSCRAQLLCIYAIWKHYDKTSV